MGKTNKHWYNNGIKEQQSECCPEGWVPGRLAFSDSHIKACRQARLGMTPWNKGLTKDMDSRVAVSTDTKKAISRTTIGKKKSPEHAKHISDGLKGKTIPLEVRRKISSTLKGRPIPPDILKLRQEKEYATKLYKGTFNSSLPESVYYDILVSIFNDDKILKQYSKDDRYKYATDFYIKPLDVFIECNFHQSHYKHPFDATNQEDIDYLNKIISKQDLYITKEGKQRKNSYYKYEEVFTKKDPEKLKTAIKNKINYVLIYNKCCYFYKSGNLLFTLTFKDLMYDINIIKKVVNIIINTYAP